MKLQGMLSAGCLAIAIGMSGCSGGAQAVSDDEVDVEALLAPSTEKVYHEWKKIYLVEIESGTRTRREVGFLDRRYRESEPDGLLFVLDRKLQVKGFMLPSGKTFVNEARSGQDLKMKFIGAMNPQLAMRELLNAKGTLELEMVQEATTAPAPAPAPKDE